MKEPPFTVGSMPPHCYVAWHEWAQIQYEAGLRQEKCPLCGLWQFPQEMSTRAGVLYAVPRSTLEIVQDEQVRIRRRAICLACESKRGKRQ